MLSRSLAAVVVLFVVGTFLTAGEHTGIVTSVSKDEIKMTVGAKKGEKGTEKTFKVGKDVKITKKVDDKDETVSLEDATKMATEGKGKIKGFRAKVTTEGEGDKEMVTAIAIQTGKKK